MHLRLCNPEPSADAPAALLHAAVAEQHAHLCRSIGGMVYRVCGRMHPDAVAERVHEILNETVQRALGQANQFDPSRSAFSWLMGIAARVLAGQRRQDVRDHRQTLQTDLGEKWEAALAKLCSVPADAAARIDLQQALAQLDESARHALECRYTRGLEGDDLARALDVATAGAARVRVCRALQALRKLIGAADSEVTS
jgi:RNA polymerase sigma factor (sigma-70 family)